MRTDAEPPANAGTARGTAAGMTTGKQVKDVSFRLATGAHRAVFRLSKGRVFDRFSGMSFAELVTTGRTSGRERSTMLAVPVVEPDRLVLVASFGGDDRHPAWYLNLRSNPRVRVTMAGRTRAMTARTATADERARLWPQVTAVYRGYARYQERTTRSIPLVILEPGRPE